MFDISKVTVYDLLDCFDSYVADVENNIAMDPEEWEKYQKDPKPFLSDLLMDFGKFDAFITNFRFGSMQYYEAVRALVAQALKNYV